MRSVLAVVFVVLVGAALGGGYYYYTMAQSGGAAGAGAGGPPGGFAMPVEAQPVRVGSSERQIQAIGTLRSNESVVVRTEVAGRLAAIEFTEGQKVAKGAVLVRLESSVQAADLAQAKAAVELARANFSRAEELVKRNAGTPRALDEARWKLQNDEAAVQLKQAMIDKMVLTAPFDGVLGLRRVSIGDYMGPGADIVNLEQIDPLKVDFRVPELFLPAVRTGQKIGVAVDAVAGRKFDGEVIAIDPLVDAAGRSVVIRARIANPDGALRPGLFARVELVLDQRQNAVFVPEQALVPVGDQQFVFRVVDGPQGAKIATLTKVRLGARRKAEVEVLEGLPGDAVIVTGGQLKIRDGMPVQVVPPPAPPNAASPPKAGSTVAEDHSRAG